MTRPRDTWSLPRQRHSNVRTWVGHGPLPGIMYHWCLALEPLPADGRIIIFTTTARTLIGQLPRLARRRAPGTIWEELYNDGKGLQLHPLNTVSLNSGLHIAHEVLTYWGYEFQAAGYEVYGKDGKPW